MQNLKKLASTQKCQLGFFILFYLVLWVLIPSLFLHGMYLDSSENIAWSTTFDYGNYKHPPLGGWFVSLAIHIMPTSLSAILTLSAIAILVSYYYIYRLGREFMSHERTVFAILLTSTIYYMNVRSMQFNQNIVMLPFWSAAIYFFYKSIKCNQKNDWMLLGIAVGFSMLAKYESIVIILILFSYLIFNFKKEYLLNIGLSIIISVIIFSPNLYWLIVHDFLPIKYVDMRAGLNPSTLNNWVALHILSPLKYLEEQTPLLLYPIIFAFIFGEKNKKLSKLTRPNLFLILSFGPFVVVLLLAIMVGMKIPAEWSYPFFLFTTLSCVHYFKIDVSKSRLKATIYFVVFVHITIFIVYILSMHMSHKVSTFNQPAKQMANISDPYWKIRLPKAPLKYVIGDNYFIGLIPGFTKERPQALLNFSFKDSPYLNKAIVEKSGALGIGRGCPKGVPTKVQEIFPENKVTLKCFIAKTVNTFHPVEFKFFAYIIMPKK